MSWYASLAAWSALIRLFEIDYTNNNNNDNPLLLEWWVNDNKSDNYKDKVYLLLKR